MKKKRFIKTNKNNLLILTSLILLLIIPLVISQSPPMPNIPLAGEVDEETGLPENFKKFKEMSGQLSEEESKKAYLKREWTKIFAKNKVLGPIFFFLNKFFTFFDPVWKIIFGMPFSFSWAFFLSVFIWGALIFILLKPMAALFKNPLFGLIGSIIVASLVGITGVIRIAVGVLETAVTGAIKLTILFILMIIVLALYSQLMKGFGEESEEEKLARSKENIKAHGKVSRHALDELGSIEK